MTWVLLFFLISMAYLALWQGARLAAARDECDAMAYAARQARARAVRAEDDLAAAHRTIAKLKENCTSLAIERPMTFRDIPMYHAAHVKPAARGCWVIWDN